MEDKTLHKALGLVHKQITTKTIQPTAWVGENAPYATLFTMNDTIVV